MEAFTHAMHAFSDGVEAAVHVVDAAVHVADAAAHAVEAAVDVVDAVVDTVVDAVSDVQRSPNSTTSNCAASFEEYSEADGRGADDQDALDEYDYTPQAVEKFVEVEYIQVSSSGSAAGVAFVSTEIEIEDENLEEDE